jgi:hypothetical protein
MLRLSVSASRQTCPDTLRRKLADSRFGQIKRRSLHSA